MFHYLSAPDAANPFDDDYSRDNPGRVPRLSNLTRDEMSRENQDPQEELDWGRKMSGQRSKFLKELVDEMEMEKKRKKNPPPIPPPVAPTPPVTLSGLFMTYATYVSS